MIETTPQTVITPQYSNKCLEKKVRDLTEKLAEVNGQNLILSEENKKLKDQMKILNSEKQKNSIKTYLGI